MIVKGQMTLDGDGQQNWTLAATKSAQLVEGTSHCPRAAIETAQGRSPNLLSCVHEDWTAQPTRRNAASSGSRDKRPDTVARDGFGQAMRLALGDDDVSVVEEPVHSCRGESSREDRVEPRRMQVRGHDERLLESHP
jgi:hypothetical protein